MASTDILGSILIFILGSMIGSFLNVCIYRIPRGESIVFPNSHCPKCTHTIRSRDNIPIFSYLLLEGKCRFCKEPISIQYPIVEGITAVLLLLIFIKYGLSLDFLLFGFFGCVLVLLSAIDIERLIIPNKIILPSMGIGFLLVLITDYSRLPESLLGFAAGGGLLLLVALIAPFFLKEEGLGGGDIKLAAFIGIFLGWFALMAIFWGFFLGALLGLALLTVRCKDWKDPLTFGPFLSVGALITLFGGPYLWRLYLNIIGMR